MQVLPFYVPVVRRTKRRLLAIFFCLTIFLLWALQSKLPVFVDQERTVNLYKAIGEQTSFVQKAVFTPSTKLSLVLKTTQTFKLIPTNVGKHGSPGFNFQRPLSVTNKIAILILDDNFGNAFKFFLPSAKRNLVMTFGYSHMVGNVNKQAIDTRQATYFVFTNSSQPEDIDDNVVRVSIPSSLSMSQNPCQVYSEYSGQADYFDRTLFDHVFSFNPRMQFVQAVNLVNEILGKRVAVTHPIYYQIAARDARLLPFDRRVTSCAYVPVGNESRQYFSGELFGGETDEVAKMCRKISSCHYNYNNVEEYPEGNPAFHQLINHYYQSVEPSKVLSASFCIPTGVSELFFHPNKITFDERNLPVAVVNPLLNNGNFFEKRNKRVQWLVSIIKKNYFAKKSYAFNKNIPLQFLSFFCDESSGCGDFGDHIRGLSSMLYLAIGLDKTYHVDWKFPSQFSDFFYINSNWYNVSSVSYEMHFVQAAYKSAYVGCEDYDMPGLLDKISSPWKMRQMWPGQQLRPGDFRPVYVTNTATNAGRLLLESLFKKFSLYYNFQAVMPLLSEYKTNTDTAVLMSSAMRLLLGSPTPFLEESLSATIAYVGNNVWTKSLKIGVEVRSKCPPTVDRRRPHCKTILPKQWECFSEKVSKIIAKVNSASVLIAVVADKAAVGDTIAGKFKDNLAVKIVNVLTNGSMSTDAHGWLLLTRMDWLVVTGSSSLGETASVFSLKPTYRYDGACLFSWYNTELRQQDPF